MRTEVKTLQHNGLDTNSFVETLKASRKKTAPIFLRVQ